MGADYHQYKFDQGKARFDLIASEFISEAFIDTATDCFDFVEVYSRALTSPEDAIGALCSKMGWLPEDLYRAIARVLTFGAHKYEDDSWQKVPDGQKRYTAALGRHLLLANPHDIDPDSGMLHAWHAACNLYFLWWFEEIGEDE